MSGDAPKEKRVLAPEDMTMRIEFRTHCPRCGVAWAVMSEFCVPEKKSFENYVNKMRRNLEDEPKICCSKKLPIIGEEWGRIWP